MPSKELTTPHDSKRRRSLTLTVTEDCNLRCRYCYEPTKSRDRYMSLKVAQRAITTCMEAEDEFEEVQIDFFGGEPMLAFGLIRDVVEWFHSREWRKKHLFFIGTNGTILTDEMKAWLLQNKGCVSASLSLDGNKVAHDLNRSNSYDQVMRNLPFFVEHWPNNPLKMTISAETIPYVADSIIDLEERGLFFSANLVFENVWGTDEEKARLLDIYAAQLERLIEYYAARPDLYPARMLDHKAEYLSAADQRVNTGDDCVRWCGAGHEMVVVGVDGDLYPCHRFSPWVTGRPAPAELVNHQSQWQPEQCAQCRLNRQCPTCAGFNWQENGDAGTRTTYHCEAFKLEVLASLKLQALRLLGRQPSELARVEADEAGVLKRRLDAILEIASTGF